jgi:membrane-bound ClpP family serine protease
VRARSDRWKREDRIRVIDREGLVLVVEPA